MVFDDPDRGPVEAVSYNGRTYQIWLYVDQQRGYACPAIDFLPPMQRWFCVPESLGKLLLKRSTLKKWWDSCMYIKK